MSAVKNNLSLDIDEILVILAKPIYSRSYDDLLLLSAYISNIDFVKRRMKNVALKEMFELCKYFSSEVVQSGEDIYRQGEIGIRFEKYVFYIIIFRRKSLYSFVWIV